MYLSGYGIHVSTTPPHSWTIYFGDEIEKSAKLELCASCVRESQGKLEKTACGPVYTRGEEARATVMLSQAEETCEGVAG